MWQSLLFKVIKSTARKRGTEENHKQYKTENQIMGTPREYGFNDISKENILKADPLSFFFFSFFFSRGCPHSVTPFSRQVDRCGREGGHNTSLKPTVWLVRPTQSRWPTAVLVSVRTRMDEGWMRSTVPECIGTAGGAGMPVLSFPLELRSLFHPR